MPTKLQCNEDLVSDLMNYSPYGGLGQAFIMYAIAEYAKQVIAADPATSPGEGLFNSETWVSIAKDVQTRCAAFYGRHDHG